MITLIYCLKIDIINLMILNKSKDPMKKMIDIAVQTK